MKNKRLQLVAEFIEPENKVADIGCDHGYLAIYLKKHKNCPVVIASDINENALKVAIKNIAKEKLAQDIPCLLSNGVENLPINKIDTIIIAGMGTHTILNILENKKIINLKNIILQSNNEYELLRLEMSKKGYRLVKEAYIEENHHDYFIMKYQKGRQKLTESEIKYGILNQENKRYYEKVLKRKKEILKNIPLLQFHVRKAIKKEIRLLKERINQTKKTG